MRYGVDRAAAILLTHDHPDHEGSALRLARQWGCAVHMHPLTGLLRQRPGCPGPPWYTTWNRRLAWRSIQRLARLDPTVLAGGHGEPMTGPGTAAALRAFAGLAGTEPSWPR